MSHRDRGSRQPSSIRAFRLPMRTAKRSFFVRASLLLAILVVWLPAALAAQAPDGSVSSEPASPQTAIWSVYPIYGGNMTALAADPNASQVFYVGTETAGVYKTTDTGGSWQTARTGLPPTAEVISLRVDPQNPNIVYAGTDAVGIIWKSQDAGETWTNFTHNMPSGTFAYAYQAFNIVVEPHNSNAIYVGLGGYEGQIYKTTDGGTTWWVMDSGIPRDRENYTKPVLALAMDPDQPSVLYAGGRDFGVYKTTDGGANWTALNDGVPSYRDLYKAVTALTIDPLHGNRPAGIIDGQYYVFGADSKWSQVSTGYGVNNSYDHAHLYFHPTDPKIIYSAGGSLTKSSDGGINWVSLNSGPYNGAFPDVALHLSAPNTLLAANQSSGGGNTGGVRKSPNGGLGWIDASVGLTAQPIQGVAIDPQNPKNLYAGRSTTGTGSGVWRSTDRGATWHFTQTDGWLTDIAVDPLNSQRVYAAAMYLLVSNDQGATFQKALDGFYDPGATCLAIAPGASNPVYAGGAGVYKSTDSGLTWLPKKSGFPTDSGGNTAKVMSLAIDPNNTAVVWAGTQNEGLVKSTNGGDSWGLKGFVDVPDVDGIAVKPGDSNTILVGTGDYRGSGGTTGEIYKSTDGGQSWQLKYRGKATVTDFVYDPRNSNWIYTGTSYLPNYSSREAGEGVLRSIDGGEHWSNYSSGLFNRAIFSLAISAEDPPLLLAGTMGSGLYGTQPPRLKPAFLPLMMR